MKEARKLYWKYWICNWWNLTFKLLQSYFCLSLHDNKWNYHAIHYSTQFFFQAISPALPFVYFFSRFFFIFEMKNIFHVFSYAKQVYVDHISSRWLYCMYILNLTFYSWFYHHLFVCLSVSNHQRQAKKNTILAHLYFLFIMGIDYWNKYTFVV